MPEELTVEESSNFVPVLIPEDVYIGTAVSIRDLEFDNGPAWAIGFEIEKSHNEANMAKLEEAKAKDKELGEDGNGGCVIIDGVASARLTPKTKLFGWAKKLGIAVNNGAKITKTDIIGKKATLSIATKERIVNNEKTYVSYVKDIIGLSQ